MGAKYERCNKLQKDSTVHPRNGMNIYLFTLENARFAFHNRQQSSFFFVEFCQVCLHEIQRCAKVLRPPAKLEWPSPLDLMAFRGCFSQSSLQFLTISMQLTTGKVSCQMIIGYSIPGLSMSPQFTVLHIFKLQSIDNRKICASNQHS